MRPSIAQIEKRAVLIHSNPISTLVDESTPQAQQPKKKKKTKHAAKSSSSSSNNNSSNSSSDESDSEKPAKDRNPSQPT